MGVLHMPTPAGHHPLKSYPRHEAPPQIILKVVSSIREFEGMGVWKVVFWVSFK